MSECSNGSEVPRILAALAVGALVGAGVAILCAPQSGKETRDMVAKKTHDIKDAAGAAIDRGKHLVSEVKQKTMEAFERGSEVAREVGKAASRSA